MNMPCARLKNLEDGIFLYKNTEESRGVFKKPACPNDGFVNRSSGPGGQGKEEQ